MITYNPRLRSRMTEVSMWVVGILISILYLFHFQNTNNDFKVFMKAGEIFLERGNPWVSFTDPNAMYLNGSATLIFSSLLSFMPIEFALFLVRIANILAMLTTSFLIGRKYSLLPVPAIFIFTLLIFPFRSAMEYGQYTILFALLSFLLIQNVLDKKHDSVLAISSFALVIDFKPHIVIGLFVIILLHKRFALVFKALGVWFINQLIVGFWSQTIPVYEWYLAIKRRSNFVSHGEDNLSLVSNFGSIQFWFVSCFLAIAMFTIWSHLRNSGVDELLLIQIVAVALIMSPLLHPTDMLLVALILFSKFDLSRAQTILIGLFLVWSPLPSGAIFTLVTITILFFLLSLINKIPGKLTYLPLVGPYLCYLLAVKFGLNEVSVRHLLQQCILIIIALLHFKPNQKRL